MTTLGEKYALSSEAVSNELLETKGFEIKAKADLQGSEFIALQWSGTGQCAFLATDHLANTELVLVVATFNAPRFVPMNSPSARPVPCSTEGRKLCEGF